MTASRLFQAATSAGIAAIAGVALICGVQVVFFNADVARVEAAAASAVPDPATRTQWIATEAAPALSPRDAAAMLAQWQTTPGVGGTARTMIAARGAGSSQPERLLEITRALSVAPTAGAQWLAFADVTLRLGYGTEHALRAYDMATLTARREGDQMLARALLVLREWERMPEETRRAGMAGLGEVGRSFGKAGVEAVRGAVAANTVEARKEIADALAPKLGGDKAFQKAVGL